MFVADTGNSRVAEFDTPLTNFTMNRVFGQDFDDDFVLGGPSLSQTGLNQPTGLAFDSRGNLYVADQLNGRVLEFAAPFPSSPLTPIYAAAAWGQGPTFMSALCYSGGSPVTPVSAGTMCTPIGVAFDGADDLYVTDSSLSRVLEFQPAIPGATPPSFIASTELGQ